MDDTVIMFSPNIETILYWLENSPENYPPNIREYDWAFADFPAIPCCYKLVLTQGDVPSVIDAANHLILSRWPDFNQKRDGDKSAIRNRALKLTLDFYRDLHAMALLAQKFGSVKYEKGYDLSYNVDYRVTPKPFLFTAQPRVRAAKLGVAAAMMHPRHWQNPENDITQKLQRRARRGCKEWDGDVFWLTNRVRPYWKNVKGVWLFGANHISDLIEEIKAKYSDDDEDGKPGDLGIIQLPLF